MQEKVSLPENTKRRSRLTKQSHSENRQKHDAWNPAIDKHKKSQI